MNFLVRFKIIVSLLFIPVAIFAQNAINIEGYVTDSIGNPLDFVSIYANDDSSSVIISFSSTNESGYFSISLLEGNQPIRLSASLLGYLKQDTVIHLNEINKSKILVDFVLRVNLNSIEEVVIRDTIPPVQVKSDTTEYRVAVFSDSTEYSVEDLLKKLPGVQVSEQGAITVNGKLIEKVLVEGDDVFGANYTIVTRNIRANMIDMVQVIDHYQENAVLRDVITSESTVMNLSIDDDKKNIFSGTLTIGGGEGGVERKGFASTNLFSFSKRSKSIILGNWNNVGFDALGEYDAVFNSIFSTGQNLRSNILPNSSRLNLPNIKRMDMPSKFVKRGAGGLFAMNQIYHVNEQLKIKATGTSTHNENRQSFTNRTDYLFADRPFQLEEVTKFKNTRTNYELEVETQYIARTNDKSIRTMMGLQTVSNRFDLSTERILNDQDQLVPVDLRDDPQNIYTSVEYTTKSGKYSAFQFILNYSKINRPQSLISHSINYPSFFDTDSSYLNLSQELSWSHEVFRPHLTYLYKKGKYEVNLDAGSKYDKNTFSSDIALSDTNDRGIFKPGSMYSNEQTISKQANYIKGWVKRSWHNIHFFLGLKLEQLSLSMNIENGIDEKKETYWIANPVLRFSYAPNNDVNFNLFYTHSSDVPKEEMIINSWFFNDYQTIQRGLIELNTINHHFISASYSYRNPERTFFFISRASASIGGNVWGNMFDFTSLIFSQEYFRPINENSFSSFIRAERLFTSFDSRFALSFSFNHLRTENIIEGERRDVKNHFYLIRAEYGSAFKGLFNALLTSDFIINQAIVYQAKNENSISSLGWKTKVRGVFKINKKIHFDVNYYRVSNYFGKRNRGDYFTTDINGTYHIGNKKWHGNITVSIVNLFDTNSFEQLITNDYYQNHFELEAVPRFFIVKWDTSF